MKLAPNLPGDRLNPLFESIDR